MKKIKSRRGESLIETLAAMLVISLGMMLLAGAIAASARINHQAQAENILIAPSMVPSGSDPTESWSVTIGGYPFEVSGYTEGDSGNENRILRYYQ